LSKNLFLVNRGRNRRRAMALTAEGSREGGSDEEVCLICFEASPPPIQSGCASKMEAFKETKHSLFKERNDTPAKQLSPVS